MKYALIVIIFMSIINKINIDNNIQKQLEESDKRLDEIGRCLEFMKTANEDDICYLDPNGSCPCYIFMKK